MICKSYVSIPKHLKLTKKLIMDNFGEKFREYGFIPQNKGLAWYAIRNNILYSVCFEEHFRHNIYYFAQPLCSRLLRNFVNSNVKDSDISNHGYSALKDWQCQNQKLFDELESIQLCLLSDDEFLRRKLEFYHSLLNTIVFPYIESIKSVSDLCRNFKSDWNLRRSGYYSFEAINAYLSADADSFYKNYFVLKSLHYLLYNSDVCPDDESELRFCVRKAIENRDMSLIGKYLQSLEASNIEFIRSNYSDLWASCNIMPIVTDEFINSHALSEVRTTYDLSIHFDTNGINCLPFPMTTPNSTIDSEKSKKIARNIINERYSAELSARGFVSRNDGFEWHKIVDDMIYYRLWFGWSTKYATLKVCYDVRTLCDYIEVEDISVYTSPQYADLDFLKAVDYLSLLEFYPNSFDSGEETLKWQINRLDCQMHHVILPYFDSIIDLETLCIAEKGNIVGAILLNNSSLLPEHAIRYKTYQGFSVDERKIPKLTSNADKWIATREKVCYIGFNNDDMQYIRDYFMRCRDYNIKLLRDTIPSLF